MMVRNMPCRLLLFDIHDWKNFTCSVLNNDIQKHCASTEMFYSMFVQLKDEE